MTYVVGEIGSVWGNENERQEDMQRVAHGEGEREKEEKNREEVGGARKMRGGERRREMKWVGQCELEGGRYVERETVGQEAGEREREMKWVGRENERERDGHEFNKGRILGVSQRRLIHLYLEPWL